MRRAAVRQALILAAALAAAPAASAWTVDLPDSLTVPIGVVRLADLSRLPVPPEVADLLMAEPAPAGETRLLTRQGVLRRLVVEGQAAAVQFTGAARCLVRFGGSVVDPGRLQAEAERLVAALAPTGPAGAPATWCEVRLPTGSVAVTGAWALTSDRREPLPPGRSQVRLLLQDGWQTRELPASVIARAAWLAGEWQVQDGAAVVDEFWSPPRGDAMLGVSRTTDAGRLAWFELVVLRETPEGGLVFTAHPSGQEGGSFPAVTVSDTLLVFENPAHDFPQRIGYRRAAAGVTAWIEGTVDGQAKRVEFPYRRADAAD